MSQGSAGAHVAPGGDSGDATRCAARAGAAAPASVRRTARAVRRPVTGPTITATGTPPGESGHPQPARNLAFMAESLQGKVVAITGASSGIGEATALAAAQA